MILERNHDLFYWFTIEKFIIVLKCLKVVG